MKIIPRDVCSSPDRCDDVPARTTDMYYIMLYTYIAAERAYIYILFYGSRKPPFSGGTHLHNRGHSVVICVYIMYYIRMYTLHLFIYISKDDTEGSL